MDLPKLLPESVRLAWSSPHQRTVEGVYIYPDGRRETFHCWASIGNVSIDGKPIRDASVVLALTTDGDVVSVYQFRYGSNCCIHELAGGRPGEGESDEDAVRRELLEETGYQARELIPLGSVWNDPASAGSRVLGFLALDCKRIKDVQRDDVEVMQISLRPLADWFCELIHAKNAEHDSKTLAFALLALPRLPQCFQGQVMEKIYGK